MNQSQAPTVTKALDEVAPLLFGWLKRPDRRDLALQVVDLLVSGPVTRPSRQVPNAVRDALVNNFETKNTGLVPGIPLEVS